MSRLFVFLTFFVVLCGQGCRPMTNDEVIIEVAKCKSVGMYPQIVQNGWTFSVLKVVCIPHERS